MTVTGPSGRATGQALREVLALACRAPSVHNTQPWRWWIRPPRVGLRADRSRQLVFSDPLGRNLMLSCGAALHQLQVAAAGLGLSVTITRLPDPGDPDLLAIAELTPSGPPTPEALDELEALRRRQTDRRRFTAWPVTDEQLDRLAGIAQRWGSRVLPLTGGSTRALIEELADRATEIQARHAPLLGEQREWVAHSAEDGVPVASLPAQTHPGERRDRFTRGAEQAPQGRSSLVGTDGVLAICTSADTPAAWLDAGETLSAMWLRATREGLSLVPLSQVIEVYETRATLRSSVVYDLAHPQLLVRVGWQELTRPPQPMSPRRPLDDVLETPDGQGPGRGRPGP